MKILKLERTKKVEANGKEKLGQEDVCESLQGVTRKESRKEERDVVSSSQKVSDTGNVTKEWGSVLAKRRT